MLFIELFAPRGALDEPRRRELSQRLVTEVMSAPDAPVSMEEAVERSRALTRAVVREPDAWSVGGRPVDAEGAPCYLVRVSLPARHCTDAMRAELVTRVTNVLAEVDEDPRRAYREPVVWVHMIEVADGNMGAFGRVLRLADLMKIVLDDGHGPAEGGGVAEGSSAPSAVDPICGMDVALTGAPISLTHDGTTYVFCSGGCREVVAARLD